MTPPVLTDAHQAQLEVLVKPAAWAYHLTLTEDQQVDVVRAFQVHGDLRLVAADVLETVCLLASKQAASGGGVVKRLKIDGEFEIEQFAVVDAASVDASAWCEQAARLRAEVSRAGRGGLVRSPLAGMLSGSCGEPVFRVTRRGDRWGEP